MDKVTEADADMTMVGTVAQGLDTHNEDFTQMSKGVDEDSNEVTDHGNTEVTKQDGVNSRGISFHIDSGQIVPVATSEQSSELHDLGLTVFNQEDYEQGIVAQVNAAIALEESEQRKTVLQKRLQCVEESIRCTEQELSDTEKVLSMLVQQEGAHTVAETQRVRRRQQNKLKQMKKLEATKKAIVGQMTGSREIYDDGEAADDIIVLEEALGLPQLPETESQRLIRLGEMTPFGTVMSADGSSHVIDQQQNRDVMSDFEKYILDQSAMSGGRKKKPRLQQGKVTAKNSSCNRKKMAVKNENHSGNEDEGVKGCKKDGYCIDVMTKFASMDEHEDSQEGQMNERRGMTTNDDDDDYVVDEEESATDNEDTWKDRKKQHKLGKTATKSRGKTKMKSRRLARDDGDRKLYQARIRTFQKQELQKKHALLMDGLDDSSSSVVELGSGFTIPTTIWNKLYKYQKTGVSWLWELHRQQVGGIIGDEMGLGKTIQMITFLVGLATSGLRDTAITSKYKGLGPVLIVCPATVMHQWVTEFHTWWPPFCVAVLHSSGSYTGSSDRLVRTVVQGCGVIITSYSSLVLHKEILLPHDWHYVVLDEGHKIRNPDAQITLACKQFRTPHRTILSGSPIQNNLKELWSLFDFVFPGKLGTLPDFMQHFSVPIVQGGYANSTDVQVQTAYKCACVLRDCINPYLLRRMKVDVQSVLQLPDKNEQVLFCRITQHQREVYQEYLDSKECQMILSGKYLVFPGLTTVRKICNHPDLSTGGPRVFGYQEEDTLDDDMQFGYWKRSGKMIVIQSLLKIWKKQQHKVLLFTQSRQMLDIFEKFVQKQGYTYLTMDGTTAISSRQHLITKFNTEAEIFVFLLTTKVGGLGVNLTGADRVIIYDPDWNPSTDIQARERAWRIGQHRHVTIFRLLTAGTIEEKIYHRQIFKQFLTNRVLMDPKQRRFFKSNDLYELFTLADDDTKQDTETSAIFAGTGSAINLKPGSKRKSDGRIKACSLNKKRNDDDNDKTRKMKDLAKKLSEQIRRGRSCSKLDKSSVSESSGLDAVKCHSSNTISSSSDLPQEPVLGAAKHVLWSGKKRQARQMGGSKERRSESIKSRKKTKKHRWKDAVFEGSTVSHLVGLDKYSGSTASEGGHAEKDESYVLQKLLRKTGLHSAMQHDKIMMSSSPDYVLVESEAEKVAKQASLALKQSRRRINARPGVPTWTGQHGQGGAPPVTRRFGQKKNPKLLAAASATFSRSHADQTDQVPQVIPSKSNGPSTHFDGSLVGTMTASDVDTSSVSMATTMSSEELLTKMRLRNETGLADAAEEDRVTVMQPSTEYMDLITDIRNVVAFGCSTDGQATTQELLDQFASRLPSGDSARFRAMLRQICSFDRCTGIGVWRLKPEFR